jgi:hypothetical protein
LSNSASLMWEWNYCNQRIWTSKEINCKHRNKKGNHICYTLWRMTMCVLRLWEEYGLLFQIEKLVERRKMMPRLKKRRWKRALTASII